GHPLNSYARVDMTLVDGEVYFQRAERLTPFGPAAAPPTQPAAAFKPVPRNEKGLYLIAGAVVHGPNGESLHNRAVLVENGKIKSIDEGKAPAPAGTTVVNAEGLHLYPGMIDAAT